MHGGLLDIQRKQIHKEIQKILDEFKTYDNIEKLLKYLKEH